MKRDGKKQKLSWVHDLKDLISLKIQWAEQDVRPAKTMRLDLLEPAALKANEGVK